MSVNGAKAATRHAAVHEAATDPLRTLRNLVALPLAFLWPILGQCLYHELVMLSAMHQCAVNRYSPFTK
jgi:hypothetical protein